VFRFFALCERKNRNTEEDKVPLQKITFKLPRKFYFIRHFSPCGVEK
jgi:hypothetical protein